MSMNRMPFALASIFSSSVIHLSVSSRTQRLSRVDIHRRLILLELHQPEFVQVKREARHGRLGSVLQLVLLVLLLDEQRAGGRHSSRQERHQRSESEYLHSVKM